MSASSACYTIVHASDYSTTVYAIETSASASTCFLGSPFAFSLSFNTCTRFVFVCQKDLIGDRSVKQTLVTTIHVVLLLCVESPVFEPVM